MKFQPKLFLLVLLFGLLVTTGGFQSRAADDLSPIVPSLASFILPGAGQLLNDQPEKALTHFVIIVGIDTATYFLAGSLYPGPWTTYRIGTALHLAWSGYSAYDAYQVASHRRRGIFGSSMELVSSDTPRADIEIASSGLTASRPSREFSVSAISDQ